MSTVPEIVVARHCGIKVFALSLVTNNAVLDPAPRGDDVLVEDASHAHLDDAMEAGKASHEEVLAAANEAARDVQVSRPREAATRLAKVRLRHWSWKWSAASRRHRRWSGVHVLMRTRKINDA